MPLAQGSHAWAKHHTRRTAVERVISRQHRVCGFEAQIIRRRF